MNLDYPDSLSLICEALVREMRDARRWSTIEEAWTALLQHAGLRTGEPSADGVPTATPVSQSDRAAITQP